MHHQRAHMLLKGISPIFIDFSEKKTEKTYWVQGVLLFYLEIVHGNIYYAIKIVMSSLNFNVILIFWGWEIFSKLDLIILARQNSLMSVGITRLNSFRHMHTTNTLKYYPTLFTCLYWYCRHGVQKKRIFKGFYIYYNAKGCRVLRFLCSALFFVLGLNENLGLMMKTFVKNSYIFSHCNSNILLTMRMPH